MRKLKVVGLALVTAAITALACGYESDVRLCRAAGYIVASHLVDGCTDYCKLRDPLYVPWYKSIPDPGCGPSAVNTGPEFYHPSTNYEDHGVFNGTCTWVQTIPSPHSGYEYVSCTQIKESLPHYPNGFSTNICTPGT